MNSSNCKNLKLKMENEEKQLIFIAVPQLRVTNETGFVKKKFSTKKLNSNNNNVLEALNNHSDHSICLLVYIKIFYITF